MVLHENGTGVLCAARFVISINKIFPFSIVDDRDLLNHPAIEIAVHVYGDVLPVFVLIWLNFHSPKNHSERDEHRIVRDMFPGASPLAKPVHDVSLVLCIRRTGRERAVRFEVTSGIEQRRVVSVYRRVVIAHLDVHEAHGSFGDEHALVPIVLGGTVWDPNGQNGSPSEDFFDHRPQVGETREIGERWYPVATHYGV
jgi:hypothetical protein